MGLHGKIESKRCGGRRSVFLQRLEAEHQHRVLAGRGRQTADLESARIVGGGGDLAIGPALSRHRRTGDSLPPGTNDTGLHIGSGNPREHQQNQASRTKHE
jgi:xanthine/CO dehydrogenase XdhC/CoxF family maturation factor